MPDRLHVTNEIGVLREVLVHKPGIELEAVETDFLKELLFDEVPFWKAAQHEHDAFVQVLRDNEYVQGTKVHYLYHLIVQALADGAGDDARGKFINALIRQSGHLAKYFDNELTAYLNDLTIDEMVGRAMSGLLVDAEAFKKYISLKKQRRLPDHQRYILHPMPNLYFSRDAFAVIGNGIARSHMRSPSRKGENIFNYFIFKYHNDFKPGAANIPVYYDVDNFGEPFHLEGGDILNLSKNTLAVGVSQRTSSFAVENLTRNLIHGGSDIKKVLVFIIPDSRASMHLDTVFTQVDKNKFIIHANVLKKMQVYGYDYDKSGEALLFDDQGFKNNVASLKGILSQWLEADSVSIIECDSDWEQWNDAANTLAIAPGVIVCYDRNTRTNRILEENGLHVLKIPSSELVRGRGGPRCMTMPLVRDNI